MVVNGDIRTNNPFVMQSMDGLWWSSDSDR